MLVRWLYYNLWEPPPPGSISRQLDKAVWQSLSKLKHNFRNKEIQFTLIRAHHSAYTFRQMTLLGQVLTSFIANMVLLQLNSEFVARIVSSFNSSGQQLCGPFSL